ncbi:AAA family ATPase [bacterium]
MFTDKGQALIDHSKDHAFSLGFKELNLTAILSAVIPQTESCVLLSESVHLSLNDLRSRFPQVPKIMTCPGKLPLAQPVHEMLTEAKTLANEVPNRYHPGLIDHRHIICALAISGKACELIRIRPIPRQDALNLLSKWYDQETQSKNLDDLTEQLRSLRTLLLKRIFGQDHAIQAFIEGLFSAEVVAAADTERKAPRAIFIFAGPPGVGKTYLAELGASVLETPYRRYDMSAYSGHQQNEQLVGMAKSFHAAHPGTLTEFVEKNPEAILLFDEIEKAHIKTIHLFLQILDHGTLEDKYHERNVNFKDTIIIFTTNAGKQLYDRPNAMGVNHANASFHRKTILDALANEKDVLTGEPFFPQAICSRMATGYPILFNHLGINELNRIVHAELNRMADLIQIQYYKQMSYDQEVTMCLVLKESSKTDARTLRAQTESFVKTELFKFCQLFKTERLEDVLKDVDLLHFSFDTSIENLEPEVRDLFISQNSPKVLFIASEKIFNLYKSNIPAVEWLTANAIEDTLEILAIHDVDMVLIDLFSQDSETSSKTIVHFDHVPIAAKALDKGQELLRSIHERLPNIPVYLFSFESDDNKKSLQSKPIDEELFLACVQAGGARGIIKSGFNNNQETEWEIKRDQFQAELLKTHNYLHQEKAAQNIGKERKVLSFDTAPEIIKKDKQINIRLRNFKLSRAIASSDVGEVLKDVERPRTRFDDVIGAESAKKELQFFIDYLKNPRRFAALGLKPPKGVLLYGPPGTGKTMLARAMAGESNVAFITASATNFVTIWQGSGPKNVHELFDRARRYAPSIIFIDEIDAIGGVRLGGMTGNQSIENTLNALLTEMDGFTSPSSERPVFVLAATNFKVNDDDGNSQDRSLQTLDQALVRRFSRTIMVNLPDREARLLYLQKRLTNRQECKITKNGIKLIAERSAGMSIAKLEIIIETAARNAAREGKLLSDKMLEEAFEIISFGERKIWDPEEVMRTARHEAGHVIMYWVSGWWPSYVTIVSRGHFGGYMARSSDEIEKQFGQTKQQILANIRTSFGGRGAELVYYGKDGGLSTGASNDFEHATRSARAMIAQYGMDEEQGPLSTPELISGDRGVNSPDYTKLNEKVKVILKEQMDETIQTLKNHVDLMDKIVDILIKKERLTEHELKGLLPDSPHSVKKKS